MYINGGAQLSCEAAAGFVAFVKVNDIEYPVPYSLACNNGRLEDGAVPVDRVECINKPLCATCPPFETTEDSGLIPGPLLFDVNGCAYHNMKCSSAIYNKIINNMMATRVTDVKLVCSPEVEWKTNYGHPVTTTSISCLRRPCWDCDTMAFRKGAVLEPMNADDLNECMRLDLTKACDDSAEMMNSLKLETVEKKIFTNNNSSVTLECPNAEHYLFASYFLFNNDTDKKFAAKKAKTNLTCVAGEWRAEGFDDFVREVKCGEDPPKECFKRREECRVLTDVFEIDGEKTKTYEIYLYCSPEGKWQTINGTVIRNDTLRCVPKTSN
ncbi:hypothetical protein QR680_004636 [Steinernema hermaphroditum]|uniref:Uncharacterized protein n=1 Tax=Steinernema hermaphroditum TaxID=289476 RepID=A0AA39HPB6_9BILA|nr:hypothetical protein QR680_004636 [Steinernema hermaphroditum]